MNSSWLHITVILPKRLTRFLIIDNFNGLLINNRCPPYTDYIKAYGFVFSLYLCVSVGVTPGAICYTGTMKQTVDSYYSDTITGLMAIRMAGLKTGTCLQPGLRNNQYTLKHVL